MPIALTTPQLDEIKVIAAQLPPQLRSQYLQRLAELLPTFSVHTPGDNERPASRVPTPSLLP